MLFSQDEDLLAEATRRQRAGTPFAGVVYAHQLRVNIGCCIQDLELIGKATDPADWHNWVEYLPLACGPHSSLHPPSVVFAEPVDWFMRQP